MTWIHVACNNPNNGMFIGRAPELQVGEAWFECRRARAPRFTELPDGFRLAGKEWASDRSIDWFGNWCWNAYRLDTGTKDSASILLALEFLNWLRRRNLYTCTTGPAEFFDWFNGESNPAWKNGWASRADLRRMMESLDAEALKP